MLKAEQKQTQNKADSETRADQIEKWKNSQVKEKVQNREIMCISQ